VPPTTPPSTTDRDAVPDTAATAGPLFTDPLPPDGMLDITRNTLIADVVWRQRAQVGGRVRSIRVRPWGEVPTLEVVVADATGAVTVAFLGRRQVGGVALGGCLTVEGMVGARDGKLLIMNPAYDLRDLPGDSMS
jgi:hypothetical protein